MERRKETKQKPTTFWDFLIAFGSGIVNLIKLEKVICLIIIYLIIRDAYFLSNIEKGDIYSQRVLDATDIFKMILENGSARDVIYIAIILFLAAIVVMLIIAIRFIYSREINRLAKERSRLMHDIGLGQYTRLEEHRTSER